MAKKTVRDLIDGKGKTRFCYVQITSAEQANAAEAAGMDMIGTGFLPERVDFPQAAPDTHFQFGLTFGAHASACEALRDAFRAMEKGADSIYCAMSPQVVEVLAREGVPVIAHVGLIPPKATWVGGYVAVGKTADTAMQVFRDVKNYEAAGAFAVEMEVVPHPVTAEITRNTSLLTVSLGSGAVCDIQYLFSADLLGENRGHFPRHAKAFRNFATEYDRLQQERVAAYREYISEVRNGVFPGSDNTVGMAASELEKFHRQIAAYGQK